MFFRRSKTETEVVEDRTDSRKNKNLPLTFVVRMHEIARPELIYDGRYIPPSRPEFG